MSQQASAAAAVPALHVQTISGPRLIAACTIGNALEFFDFVVYSFFAATIGKLFFPSADPVVQLLLSFGTYGVGFSCVRSAPSCLALSRTSAAASVPRSSR